MAAREEPDVKVKKLRGGQTVDAKWRSDDVNFEKDFDFSSLHLKEPVLTGLIRSNFIYPSPIQRDAIPLGRLGLDLVIQAKSGTGKTCVFAVIALEMIDVTSASKTPQVLILAPTREIAQQICDVIKSIGRIYTTLSCKLFIGGRDMKLDKNALKDCHIAVGTPGRIKQLIGIKALKTNTIRLLVLDEADKLMDSKFKDQINGIYELLPVEKQMIAASATYPEHLAQFITRYMRSPEFVRKDSEDPSLIGIKQYYMVTDRAPENDMSFAHKLDVIKEILEKVSFGQCLIFANHQSR